MTKNRICKIDSREIECHLPFSELSIAAYLQSFIESYGAEDVETIAGKLVGRMHLAFCYLLDNEKNWDKRWNAKVFEKVSIEEKNEAFHLMSEGINRSYCGGRHPIIHEQPGPVLSDFLNFQVVDGEKLSRYIPYVLLSPYIHRLIYFHPSVYGQGLLHRCAEWASKATYITTGKGTLQDLPGLIHEWMLRTTTTVLRNDIPNKERVSQILHSNMRMEYSSIVGNTGVSTEQARLIEALTGLNLLEAEDSSNFRLENVILNVSETPEELTARLRETLSSLLNREPRIISPRMIPSERRVKLVYSSGATASCHAHLSKSKEYLVLEPADRDGAYYIFDGKLAEQNEVSVKDNNFIRLYHIEGNHEIVHEFLRS